MITRVINGVECRPLKNGEHRKRGDMYEDGALWDSGCMLIQSKECSQCYRPIKRATKHKPNPKASGIEAMVCADIAERQRRGIAKYGTTVADNGLTDLQWARHLYEELLDASVYMRKIIANMEAKGK